jgi:hypothetical protein
MLNIDLLRARPIRDGIMLLQDRISSVDEDPYSEKANAFLKQIPAILGVIFGYSNQHEG